MSEAEKPNGLVFEGGGQQQAQVLEGGSSTQFADTVGVIMIGVIAIFLLRALLVSQKQMRRMMENQLKYMQSLVKEQ